MYPSLAEVNMKAVACSVAFSLMCSGPALAQMNLLSAHREVYHYTTRGNNPPTGYDSTFDDFGAWSYSTDQISSILPTGVTFDGSIYAPDGGGYSESASSTLTLVFTVPSAMAWSLDRMISYPLSQAGPHLYRLNDNKDLLASLDRNASHVTASGFLDAGQYRFSIDLSVAGGPTWTIKETDDFGVNVPAPAAMTSLVLGIPLFAVTRRSRSRR